MRTGAVDVLLVPAVLAAMAAMAVMAPLAEACQIPVFRYALERWEPDPYRIAVIHQQAGAELDPEAGRLLEQLRKIGRESETDGGYLPLRIEVHGADDPASKVHREWIDAADADFATSFVLRYPESLQRTGALWHGELTKANLARLLDSPTRGEITRRLLEGHSTVWVLVESGNPEADGAAWSRLEESLKKLERTLRLPDLDDIVNDEEYQADTRVELKLQFSAVRLRRNDPAEEVFLAMLMGIEPDLHHYDSQPIAMPVFGRGRALYGLTGKGINGDTIAEACSTLIGACSCTVKDLNPGVDLLFNVDWNARVKGDAAPSRPAPELPALSTVAQPDDTIEETPPSLAAGSGTKKKSGPDLSMVVVGVLAFSVFVALLGSIAVRRATGRL